MAVRVRGGRFMIDLRHRHEDGRVERIRVAAPHCNSRRAAEAYERTVLAELRAGTFRRTGLEPPADEPAPTPTLAAFADEYLRRCEATNRPRYARSKAAIVRGLLLPAFGTLPLDRINARAIDGYRTERVQHVAPKTVNNEIGILLNMLSTALAFELVTKVPKIRPLKAPPPEVGFLSQHEQDRLLATARNEGGAWAAMVMTGLRAGLRLGELRALRWRDVDLVAGRIVVRHGADERNVLTPPKSGKPREVPIGDDLLAVLRDHRHLRTFVFDNEDATMLGEGQCRHAMTRMLRRAQLAVGDGQWHTLRHTFASELVARGATLRAVQDLLGHASLAMVLRYAHLSPDARRDAVRLLDRGHTLGTPEGEIAKTGP